MTRIAQDMDGFSAWISWSRREDLQNLSQPGLYAIAISQKNLGGSQVELIQEIAYFGMTNSRSGLKGRLRQFDRTISGGSGHGGAQRFQAKHGDYKRLTPNLYVTVRPFPCNTKAPTAQDYRVMGEVAKAEYDAFARYFEAFGRLPEFNDKLRSPKKRTGASGAQSNNSLNPTRLRLAG